MNTEKPMNTETSDGRLSKLYQAALLDETLQQQIRKDLQALPDSGQEQLKPREQRLVQDEPQLSAVMRDKLLALAMENAAINKPPSKPLKATAVPPWWKTLFGVLSPDGMMSIPLASIAGVVVGSVVTVLILRESPPPEFQTRGGDTPTDVQPAPNAAGQAITDAVRNDPNAWWAAIMALQQQPGKLPEVIDEMRSFNERYPSFDPRSR